MSKYDISLRDKRVIVTGVGDERGLGFGFATALRNAGAEVYVTDINPNVHELAKRLKAPSFLADLTKIVEAEAMVRDAVRVMGGIDIVIANAGLADITTFENDPARYMRVRDVNELAVSNTIRAAKPFVKGDDKYVLVNTSNGSRVPLLLMGAYNASKAHANMLGMWLRLELKGTGARAGLLYLSEHASPMEDNFKRSLPRLLMKDNPPLKFGHKERDPKHAVAGMLRAVRGRRAHTHVPRYSVLSRYFPAVVEWITYHMHRKVQPTVDASKREWDEVRGITFD